MGGDVTQSTTDDMLTVTTEYMSTEDNGSDYASGRSGTSCNFDAEELSKTLLPIIYSIVFILAFIGNALVILILVKYKRYKEVTNFYLLNLAIADLIFAATMPFWAHESANGTWIFGNIMCKLVTAFYSVNFYSGIFLLVCMSIDRFNAVVLATKFNKIRRLQNVKYICAFVWGFASSLSIFDIVLCQAQSFDDGITITCGHNIDSNILDWKLGLAIVQNIFGFLIPFIIMLSCYSSITITLMHTKNYKKLKAFYVILAVVLAFFFCWLPFNVIMFIEAYLGYNDAMTCEAQTSLMYAKQAAEGIAFSHCCLNPFLYAFIGIKFKNDFVRLLSEVRLISQKQRRRTRQPSFTRSSQASDAESNTSVTNIKYGA
ncbi:atypical chemokine receptor 4 [Lampetra fluviatilis]